MIDGVSCYQPHDRRGGCATNGGRRRGYRRCAPRGRSVGRL